MSYIEKMIAHYGDPSKDNITFEHKWMMLLNLPADITAVIKNLPARLYVNKELALPLVDTLRELIKRGLHTEIKKWDGSFCIRCQRGSNMPSVHSFAMAIDINAHDNPFGHTLEEDKSAGLVPFTPEFIQCFRDMGWIPGIDFGRGREDAMHFEFTKQFMNNPSAAV